MAGNGRGTGIRWWQVAGGLMLVAAGGRLIYEGLRGARPRRVARRLASVGAGVTSGIYDDVAQAAKESRHPAGAYIDDPVEEASDDSFPCSDPPAWTAR